MEATNTELLKTTEVAQDLSSLGQLKEILVTLTTNVTLFKNLSNQVKNVIKEVEKQSKELEKFKNKKSRVKAIRKEDSQPSGITKPVAISNELASFLGVTPGTLVPRNEVTKGVSEYVRKNELFDPTNKQKFLLDTKPEGLVLWKLLGEPTDGITYFNLQRYLKNHYYIKTEVPVDQLEGTKVTEDVSQVENTQESTEVKKKKIIIKKKKEPLAEEV